MTKVSCPSHESGWPVPDDVRSLDGPAVELEGLVAEELGPDVVVVNASLGRAGCLWPASTGESFVAGVDWPAPGSVATGWSDGGGMLSAGGVLAGESGVCVGGDGVVSVTGGGAAGSETGGVGAPPPASCAYAGPAASAASSSIAAIASARNKLLEDADCPARRGSGPLIDDNC
jgi:hypothetical protein